MQKGATRDGVTTEKSPGELRRDSRDDSNIRLRQRISLVSRRTPPARSWTESPLTTSSDSVRLPDSLDRRGRVSSKVYSNTQIYVNGTDLQSPHSDARPTLPLPADAAESSSTDSDHNDRNSTGQTAPPPARPLPPAHPRRCRRTS